MDNDNNSTNDKTDNYHQTVKNQHRLHLIQEEAKNQEYYDKTLISLSGGAFGISVAFFNDIVGPGPYFQLHFLELAWISWGLSLVIVLTSFLSSVFAYRREMELFEEDSNKPPGGILGILTDILNILGGLLFFAGIIMFAIFIINNLEVI